MDKEAMLEIFDKYADSLPSDKQIAKRIFEEFINTLGGDFDMYMIYCSDYLAWLDREDK